MNYFEYNGARSDDMGLRIESKNVFSAPKYDAKFTAVPGRGRRAHRSELPLSERPGDLHGVRPGKERI